MCAKEKTGLHILIDGGRELVGEDIYKSMVLEAAGDYKKTWGEVAQSNSLQRDISRYLAKNRYTCTTRQTHVDINNRC